MLKIFSKNTGFGINSPARPVSCLSARQKSDILHTQHISNNIYPEMFLMYLIIYSFQSGKALLTQLKLKLVSLRDRCNARGLFTSCCKAVKLSVFFCSQGMSVNDCTRPPGVPCFRVVAPNIPVVFSCPAVQVVFCGVLLPCSVLLPWLHGAVQVVPQSDTRLRFCTDFSSLN